MKDLKKINFEVLNLSENFKEPKIYVIIDNVRCLYSYYSPVMLKRIRKIVHKLLVKCCETRVEIIVTHDGVIDPFNVDVSNIDYLEKFYDCNGEMQNYIVFNFLNDCN